MPRKWRNTKERREYEPGLHLIIGKRDGISLIDEMREMQIGDILDVPYGSYTSAMKYANSLKNELGRKYRIFKEEDDVYCERLW